jgi:hypothetical protein
MNILNNIIKYELNDDESKAYKMAIIYIALVKAKFPNYRQPAMTGDPRKKELFKFCWKAVQELNAHGVNVNDYKLFIFAQLEVLKANNAMVRPNCLLGEKAWKRWLLFKSRFDKRKQYDTVEEKGINLHTDAKIAESLAKSKKFLENKDVVASLEDKSMARWFNNKQVCGYYILSSPEILKWIDEQGLSLQDYFGIEINTFKTK